jgi:hypothetical protein
VLYEYDLEQKERQYECDISLAQYLHSSFNSYFNLEECSKALDLSENDLSEAAQWLVDQG